MNTAIAIIARLIELFVLRPGAALLEFLKHLDFADEMEVDAAMAWAVAHAA